MLYKKILLFWLLMFWTFICFWFTWIDQAQNINKNVNIFDLHEKIKLSWSQILDDFVKKNLSNDYKNLQFIQKRKKLRDLHSKVYPTYQKALSIEKIDKKEALKLYDEVISILKKWKNSVEWDDVYVQIDIANIFKSKSQILKDLKDTKNYEATLNSTLDVYNQAIIWYKKNQKNYDNQNDKDLHIWKALEYEKGSTLEELSSLKNNKTEKKKLLIQALDSYKQTLKYNTFENCNIWCVIVDSSKIKEIYIKLKSL